MPPILNVSDDQYLQKQTKKLLKNMVQILFDI